MTTYISNAFSLQMLAKTPASIRVNDLSTEDVVFEIGGEPWISAVGHPDMAAVISNMLGREVPYNRINVSLHRGDFLYVAQVTGGRLPEGCTELPPGVRIEWRRVFVEEEAEV